MMEELKHDFRINGEERVLRLFGTDALHIFDVGAHHGRWAQGALACCPRANVHCFEISASSRCRLRDNVGRVGRICIADHGLADMRKAVDVKRFPRADWLNSIYHYPHRAGSVMEQERVGKGDNYLRNSMIETVDFIKIDVEGAEHLVLKGFEHAIQNGSIRAIQFEYGRINMITGVFLEDYCRWLESHGYVVGAVYPERVYFDRNLLRNAEVEHPNYLAIRATEECLIARLAGWEGK